MGGMKMCATHREYFYSSLTLIFRFKTIVH